MQKSSHDIIVFLVVCSILLAVLTTFIITILFLYKKRQNEFERSLESIKLNHEKEILSTQLEMQEETFKHISREIHDNIIPSLTLAKLNLHTIDLSDTKSSAFKISSILSFLTDSIADLSDVSRSLNADIIIQNGLLKAIDQELEKIRQIGMFKIHYKVDGSPIFMEAKNELIIFRVIQEAFNNIIKHAEAKEVILHLNYTSDFLEIAIKDNGVGFDSSKPYLRSAGIINMRTRVNVLNGSFWLKSTMGIGTTIRFTLPTV